MFPSIVFEATIVKFFVSVHDVLFIVNEEVFTDSWVLNSSDPLYQYTLDKGLLTISRLNVTF